jgi:hypothetical protein
MPRTKDTFWPNASQMWLQAEPPEMTRNVELESIFSLYIDYKFIAQEEEQESEEVIKK